MYIMNTCDIYKIEGTEHFEHKSNIPLLNNPNVYPNFQEKLIEFKNLIINLVENDKSATFYHLGDGDYQFLMKNGVGSASPGKRALSVSYDKLNHAAFVDGSKKVDYYCIDILEAKSPQWPSRIDMFRKVLPGKNFDYPDNFLYGLTYNKWFFENFKGKIGLIGGHNKIKLIKELMKRKEYQNYIGLEKFNDYIEIPEKFACDNLENTTNIIKKQLENSDKNTKVYLLGIGHVKNGLLWQLPQFKNAVYLDVGSAIDGIAGLINPTRPYALSWINHRLKNYNYSGIDLLQYNVHNDKKMKWID